eukprot:scaffold1472_cov310-Prasinococcus_capsulatus_cf.AAC.1
MTPQRGIRPEGRQWKHLQSAGANKNEANALSKDRELNRAMLVLLQCASSVLLLLALAESTKGLWLSSSTDAPLLAPHASTRAATEARPRWPAVKVLKRLLLRQQPGICGERQRLLRFPTLAGTYGASPGLWQRLMLWDTARALPSAACMMQLLLVSALLGCASTGASVVLALLAS